MPNISRRREFLKMSAATALAGMLPGRAASAADDMGALYQRVIPARKGLEQAWAMGLARRHGGELASISTKEKSDLPHIGMTVGGIGCGTVYLAGDGRLWVWDIFHQPHEGVVPQTTEVPAGMANISGAGKKVRERDGSNYINPPTPESHPNPFHQGFVLSVEGKEGSRKMDGSGWKEVAFNGQWPVGHVAYADPDCPVAVKLAAWTPFIPLSLADSSWPATVMEFTIHNLGTTPARIRMAGELENPVFVRAGKDHGLAKTSRALKENGLAMLVHEGDAGDEARKRPDWGSMVLAALHDDAVIEAKEKEIGRVEVAREIAPGASVTVVFLLAWHFPNGPAIKAVGARRPQFAARFPDATGVARSLAKEIERLRERTFEWTRVWHDSTLPEWLLERAILTTNTLQTTTCHIFEDGRFWAWEGIGCCPGTCAHVWHYAQGVARLFPEIERNLREVTDYGIAQNPDGSIRFRAEAAKTVAIDSQTGILLRTWREHLCSPDDSFLKRVWPGAKRALTWLLEFDSKGRGGLDGLLDGEQHNTLDAEWYGKVHCLCSLYLASLRAGEEMARVVGDEVFAAECRRVHALGAEKMSTLFNGEFYIQEEDPAHAKAIGVGTGCYIDQVIGQWWAHQIGLGRVYDEASIRKALHSLWRYNFSPEIGAFRKAFNQGRFYALPGEAGLVMCTWPKGGLRDDFKKHWQYAYFNECMSGFEWQAAAHMIQEGSPIAANEADKVAVWLDEPTDPRSLTARGLAVARAIHDRHAPSRRNPYNEIECSDHYARANASYSVFLAACGFSHDGPAGQLGFAPKLSPEDFRAPFTTAEGWGTFSQKIAGGKLSASLEQKHGSLRLVRLDLVPGQAPKGAIVRVTGRVISPVLTNSADTATLIFNPPIQISKGEKLEIELE